MIQFEKAHTNSIVVTVTENATVANPIYLFRFTNQQTNVDYYFIATDTSIYKERFNKFSVIDKANPNTLNGETQLGNAGYYDYEISQTSLSSTSGLTTALDAVQYITKSVEIGLVWVLPTASTDDEYSPVSETSIVYHP